MKAVAALFIASVALAGAGALAAAVDMDPLAVHAGLSGPAAAWGTAMEAGDLDALARMHGRETISYPPDTTEVKGIDAIMKGYASLFAKYKVRVKDDGSHWVESGPLVVSWGRTTLTLHRKAGGPDVVSHTRYTDAAVRIDGGWRYLVDQASIPTDK